MMNGAIGIGSFVAGSLLGSVHAVVLWRAAASPSVASVAGGWCRRLIVVGLVAGTGVAGNLLLVSSGWLVGFVGAVVGVLSVGQER